MSNIFDFAIDEEWIQINPIKFVMRPKNTGPNIDPFGLEQVEIILDNVTNDEQKDYLECRFFTGLRGEEIDALEIHHVNPNPDKPEIRNSKYEIRNKFESPKFK